MCVYDDYSITEMFSNVNDNINKIVKDFLENHLTLTQELSKIKNRLTKMLNIKVGGDDHNETKIVN